MFNSRSIPTAQRKRLFRGKFYRKKIHLTPFLRSHKGLHLHKSNNYKPAFCLWVYVVVSAQISFHVLPVVLEVVCFISKVCASRTLYIHLGASLSSRRILNYSTAIQLGWVTLIVHIPLVCLLVPASVEQIQLFSLLASFATGNIDHPFCYRVWFCTFVWNSWDRILLLDGRNCK